MSKLLLRHKPVEQANVWAHSLEHAHHGVLIVLCAHVRRHTSVCALYDTVPFWTGHRIVIDLAVSVSDCEQIIFAEINLPAAADSWSLRQYPPCNSWHTGRSFAAHEKLTSYFCVVEDLNASIRFPEERASLEAAD